MGLSALAPIKENTAGLRDYVKFTPSRRQVHETTRLLGKDESAKLHDFVGLWPICCYRFVL